MGCHVAYTVICPGSSARHPATDDKALTLHHNVEAHRAPGEKPLQSLCVVSDQPLWHLMLVPAPVSLPAQVQPRLLKNLELS